MHHQIWIAEAFKVIDYAKTLENFFAKISTALGVSVLAMCRSIHGSLHFLLSCVHWFSFIACHDSSCLPSISW